MGHKGIKVGDIVHFQRDDVRSLDNWLEFGIGAYVQVTVASTTSWMNARVVKHDVSDQKQPYLVKLEGSVTHWVGVDSIRARPEVDQNDELKVGDRVAHLICEARIGTVTGVGDTKTTERPYHVKWDGSYEQNYSREYLLLLPPEQQTAQKSETKPQIETPKENKMSKVSAVVSANKEALIVAAKVEAGQIAINKVTKLIAPKLPMMVRGYADSPVGKVVIANLVNFGIQQYASDNDKAQIVADAMMTGAMVEFVKSFNIEKLINELVGSVDISKLTDSE